jgi:hypothetical protein
MFWHGSASQFRGSDITWDPMQHTLQDDMASPESGIQLGQLDKSGSFAMIPWRQC